MSIHMSVTGDFAPPVTTHPCKRYIKKEVPVEAWQMRRGTNPPQWFVDAVQNGQVYKHSIKGVIQFLSLRTTDGLKSLMFGDYVVREADGKLSVVRKDIFKQMYEPVNRRE